MNFLGVLSHQVVRKAAAGKRSVASFQTLNIEPSGGSLSVRQSQRAKEKSHYLSGLDSDIFDTHTEDCAQFHGGILVHRFRGNRSMPIDLLNSVFVLSFMTIWILIGQLAFIQK